MGPRDFPEKSSSNEISSGSINLDSILHNETLKPQLIGMVLDKKELHDLRVISPYLSIANINPANKSFQVIVKGVQNTPLNFKMENGKLVIDKASEKAFVQNPDFYKHVYLEGLRNHPQVVKYFDDLANQIEKLPEDYLFHFASTLKNKGLSLKIFAGSVPDPELKSLVLSKKYMSLAKLGKELSNCNSINEVKDKRNQVFDPILIEINNLNMELARKNLEHQRNGTDFSTEEIEYQVVRKLISAGNESFQYSIMLEELIDDVFGRLITTNSTSSDAFYKGLSFIATYVYYTGNIDNKVIDKIDYSDIFSAKSKDGLERLNYCKYVELTLFESFPDTGTKVLDFEAWKKSHYANSSPGSEIDQLPALDMAKLLDYYEYNFNAAMNKLMRNDGIRYIKVRELINKVFKKDANGESQASMEMNPILTKKRSEQYAHVHKRIDSYVQIILRDDKYWLDISFLDKAKVLWEKLAN